MGRVLTTVTRFVVLPPPSPRRPCLLQTGGRVCEPRWQPIPGVRCVARESQRKGACVHRSCLRRLRARRCELTVSPIPTSSRAGCPRAAELLEMDLKAFMDMNRGHGMELRQAKVCMRACARVCSQARPAPWGEGAGGRVVVGGVPCGNTVATTCRHRLSAGAHPTLCLPPLTPCSGSCTKCCRAWPPATRIASSTATSSRR
jgi:hypothetical protein